MLRELTLKISEPWDFTSSDGDNILNCIVIREIRVESFEVLLCKCTSVFKLNSNEIEFIGLVKRGNTGNQFNVYKITNADALDDETLAFNKENIQHIMIGTIQI